MVCTRCAGAGKIHNTPYTLIACEQCAGTGERDRITPKVIEVLCPWCRGNGERLYRSPAGIDTVITCRRCDGSGKVPPAIAFDYRSP